MRSEGERGPSWVKDNTNDERRTRVVDDIFARLKNVCSHLSDSEFRWLVEQMAERQLKGERRGVNKFPSD